MKCNLQAGGGGKGGGPTVKFKTSLIFNGALTTSPAHTKPQRALFNKMAQLQVNRDNFSMKLDFKPKGQTLPWQDFAISGMRTYASAPKPLSCKQFRESHRALLTNPKFYDLTLCCPLGNTHQHLWGQTLGLQQAWTTISWHFSLLCWHICWQVHTRGLCR